MEISERGQYHAALLAMEQINRKGGINGRKIRPFVADSASNPYIAAREAEKLIVEHKVVAIIGLYTSASRKEVIPIIEKYNSVLLYLMDMKEKNCTYTVFLKFPTTSNTLLAGNLYFPTV